MGIVRNRQHRLPRRVNPKINQPEVAPPALITAADATGTVLTLTFDQVVSLERGKVPAFTTDVAGPEPVSAQATGPNVVAITFDAAIDMATAINIPFRDPAIRTSGGGFVTSTTFPLAA